MWHGRHFMLPFVRKGFPFKVLISRHIDGEINAIAAEWLGFGTVRGSGDHGRRFHVKGGVSAFRSMMDALAAGWNMALTADVPKVSHVAGLGIIKLASATGRPISGCAGDQPPGRARQRDRSAINLPLSRGAVASATRSACRPRPMAKALNKHAACSKRPSIRRPNAHMPL